MKKNLILILLFAAACIKPQTYPPAVEVWSEPIRVDSLAERFVGEGFPSLTQDYSKMFLGKATKVSVSHKIDTLWSLPVALNTHINNGSPIRNPSLNREASRLYYCRRGLKD